MLTNNGLDNGGMERKIYVEMSLQGAQLNLIISQIVCLHCANDVNLLFNIIFENKSVESSVVQ